MDACVQSLFAGQLCVENKKSAFSSQYQTTLQQHYLLNDPVDDQRVLQDVLADARVEHDPCDRQDWDTE